MSLRLMRKRRRTAPRGSTAMLGCAAGLSLLMVLACGGASAEEVTLISGLDTREEVDEFANRVRSAMAEPVETPRTEGTGAMRVRMFAHPSLERAPELAANARLGGLRYCNWAPYEQLMLDLHNPGEEPLGVLLFVASGETEHVVSLLLPAGHWTTAEVSIADLQAAGLDVGDIEALGVRGDLQKRPMPSRMVVDHVRLVGTDVEAIRAARREEDARNARRPPRRPRRSLAAQGVVRPRPTGETIRRCVDAPVIASPDVLVVGGGLAGVAAAVTAARLGADVLLVERAGSLGGMATTGLVPPAFNEALSEGIVREFCDRLEEVGGQEQMRSPEVMKHVLLRMMRDSGAKVMLYALAVDAFVEDGAIRGIIVENKSGAQAIRARIVIDCTGDGDIAARAGAPFEVGRGRDDQTQTHTLVFLLGNVDTAEVTAARQDVLDLLRQAREEHKLRTPFAAGSAIQPVIVGEHGVVNVNMINVPEVSGLRVEDLTYSHIEAQQGALELVGFFREYVAGCEECYLLGTAEFIGVRESRRIVGEYVLTGEEVLTGATFEDGIARGFYPIDIHAADGTGDASGAQPNKPYEIPYRCLVPKEIENLLVAGRCISADHVAHGSLRVMGTTMPLGEAAGCAAALCILEGQVPRQLPGEKVRAMLTELGGLPDYGTYVPDNLALAEKGTVATADSVLPTTGNVPFNAVDGLITRDMMSRWVSDRTPGPHWLQLEFPQPQTFSRVRLHFFAHERSPDALQYVPRGFDVQIKEGDEWVTVVSAGEVEELSHLVEFEPVTAKTMRVLFTTPCATDDIIRLREIVVQ